MKRRNFGDIPAEFDDLEKSPVVIVPVAYDGTSTWIKGADRGPSAIIEASASMELYDIETGTEVYRKGIFTDKTMKNFKSPEAMARAVHERITYHLDRDKFTVLLGGEHSVSIGAIEAYAEKYRDLTILQLDAHADTREEYEGSRYNHACVMARAREHSPIVQAGIRSMDASERASMKRERIFFAENMRNDRKWIKKILTLLTKNVYVTIDLDVFDPSMLPSTGTPEPGGLNWYDVIDLMREVSKKRRIVGFDVVELCPGPEKSSDFTAAKLVYKILSLVFLDNPLATFKPR